LLVAATVLRPKSVRRAVEEEGSMMMVGGCGETGRFVCLPWRVGACACV
jgi:hypothetical protein